MENVFVLAKDCLCDHGGQDGVMIQARMKNRFCMCGKLAADELDTHRVYVLLYVQEADVSVNDDGCRFLSTCVKGQGGLTVGRGVAKGRRPSGQKDDRPHHRTCNQSG